MVINPGGYGVIATPAESNNDYSIVVAAFAGAATLPIMLTGACQNTATANGVLLDGSFGAIAMNAYNAQQTVAGTFDAYNNTANGTQTLAVR